MSHTDASSIPFVILRKKIASSLAAIALLILRADFTDISFILLYVLLFYILCFILLFKGDNNVLMMRPMLPVTFYIFVIGLSP